MSAADLLALLPYLVLAAAALVLMIAIAWRRQHAVCAWISALGLALSLVAVAVTATHAPRMVTPLLRVDGYSLFYTGLVVASAFTVTLLSYGYLRERGGEPPEEYYLLLLLATLGASIVVTSLHFAAFFLGLETLSVSLLGLIGYPRARRAATEASLKYLILSGMASALLLFGVALLYQELGTLSFTPLAADASSLAPSPPGAALSVGVALVLIGIGFKLSVVPFHLWAPDVYQGAPAPVSAFIAVVSKCAVMALLLRYFAASRAYSIGPLLTVISVIAVLSILMGNLLALLQNNLKRLLAYSSIAHLGYVLVAFLAGGALAIEAVSAYLVAYAVTTLGAFGVVTRLSRGEQPQDAEQPLDYRGLFWTRPALALTLMAMLLSLAGIPLTLGFIAKFYALSAGVGARLTAPTTALIVGSIIGLYYYLRWIVLLLQPAPGAAVARSASSDPAAGAEGRPTRRAAPGALLGNGVLALLVVALVVLGVYPAPLVALIDRTAGSAAASAASAALSAPQAP